MTNAGTAKKWLLDYYKGDESCVAKHFAVRVPSWRVNCALAWH